MDSSTNSGDELNRTLSVIEEVTSESGENHNASNSENNYLVEDTEIKKDALDAVRKDPAVLEAHLTLEGNEEVRQPPTAVNDEQFSMPFDPIFMASSWLPRATFPSFSELLGQQVTALLSLTEEQLELFFRYVHTLREQRLMGSRSLECAFCKNNGEAESWYTTHNLKDYRGKVLCPVLRSFRCPRCGATGDRAHTIKYCPENLEAESSNSSFKTNFPLE